ncbi:MAG: rhomboid family intramembrane serine protease [Ilumatobacteraceae bacterium]
MAGRFQLSFPGRRGEDDPWFRIGTLDITTARLVALVGGLSMFLWAISPAMMRWFVLFSDDVLRGQIWRLVTWPLYNEPSIWTVATLAMLWIFGGELERMVGRTRFAVLLLILAFVPGLFATGLGITLFGIRSIEIAVFCLFAAEFPNVRFFFGIPAWVFAVVIVGIEMLQLVGNRQSELIIQLLVSLATAALAGRGFGLLKEYAWIPRLGGGGSGGSGTKPKSSKRKQSRDFDRVVTQGPWTGPSSADQAEMDGLLDKMNSVGLSETERKRLSELGKRLRGR